MKIYLNLINIICGKALYKTYICFLSLVLTGLGNTLKY